MLGRAADALEAADVFAAARVAGFFAVAADFESAGLSAPADVSLAFADVSVDFAESVAVVLEVAPLFGSAVDFEVVLVADFASVALSVDCAILDAEDDDDVEGIEEVEVEGIAVEGVDEDDDLGEVEGIAVVGGVEDDPGVVDGAGIIVESRPVRSPAVDGSVGADGDGFTEADVFGGGECIMSRTYGTATAPTTPRTIRTSSARNHVAAKIDRGASSSYRSCSSWSSRSGLTGTSWLRDSAPCALS